MGSPTVEEMSYIPKTQQTDFGQDLDTSSSSHSTGSSESEATGAVGGTQSQSQQSTAAAASGKEKPKRNRRSAVSFRPNQEQLIVDFIRDNDILYNKLSYEYKDCVKKEALWDEFCKKNNLDKESCQTWYMTQRTQYSKLFAKKSGQGAQERLAKNKWIVDNFVFLKDHIVRQPATAKSKFKKPAVTATTTATAADDYEDEPTVHIEPLPTPGPRRARRRDTSHDAHLQHAECSRTVSASSSAAGEEHLHAVLCRTDATMGSLHTMMVKRQVEELDDRASYASWLRTEMLKPTPLMNSSRSL